MIEFLDNNLLNVFFFGILFGFVSFVSLLLSKVSYNEENLLFFIGLVLGLLSIFMIIYPSIKVGII